MNSYYQCKGCDRHLSADSFYANAGHTCKECINARDRKRRAENPATKPGWHHRLSHLDETKREADCSACGIRVVVYPNGGGRWKCSVACSKRGLRWRTNNAEHVISLRRKRITADPAQHLCYEALQRAKKHDLPFNITVADVVIPDYCPVLNLKLEVATGYRTDNSPSLDRIIPELGYVRGNVRVISWRANLLRRDATLAELEAIVADERRLHACRLEKIHQ